MCKSIHVEKKVLRLLIEKPRWDLSNMIQGETERAVNKCDEITLAFGINYTPYATIRVLRSTTEMGGNTFSCRGQLVFGAC